MKRAVSDGIRKVTGAIPKGSFRAAGTFAGNAAAGKIGGVLGGAAGDLISRITGFGDYMVNSNTIMSNTETVPTFSSSGEGIRIRHREFIQDIVGSSAFTTQLFDATSPSNIKMFPWLSGVADNFEVYRFDGLVYEFRSTSEFSTSNPALGTVLMCGIYDVNKPQFHSKQALEAYEFSTSIKPNVNGFLPIECRPSDQVTKNLLVGPQPAAGQPQFYQMCNVQIATQGQPTAYTVGELWVTYDIVLMKPRVTGELQGFYQSSGPIQAATSPAPTYLFAEHVVNQGSDTSIVTEFQQSISGTGALSFLKVGQYYVHVEMWYSDNTTSFLSPFNIGQTANIHFPDNTGVGAGSNHWLAQEVNPANYLIEQTALVKGVLSFTALVDVKQVLPYPNPSSISFVTEPTTGPWRSTVFVEYLGDGLVVVDTP